MKKVLALVFVISIFACKPEKETKTDIKPNIEKDNSTTTKATPKPSNTPSPKPQVKTSSSSQNVVTKFLNNINSLENYSSGNPITAFKDLAESSADRTFTLSKHNIKEVLSEARNYNHCVITTKDHTIVKITDLNDCVQSGSWGACMPHAKGYIKKGNLIEKNDYINNIIGIPDSQLRKAYLFN